MVSKRIICKHCGKVCYPRRNILCWSCARNPTICKQYPHYKQVRPSQRS